LIFATLWFHFLPAALLVTPYYIYKAFGTGTDTFRSIENLMTSRIFVNLFYTFWVLVFLGTLIALHLGEQRIRNIIYSSIFYLILTIEITLLLVVTVIYVGSKDSTANRVGSFQIGVVLANLIAIFFLLMLVSLLRLCSGKHEYNPLVYGGLTVFYIVIEFVGIALYGTVTGLDIKMQIGTMNRIIVISISTAVQVVIVLGILAYLWLTLEGRHSLFSQNRGPVLIDNTRYDWNISFSSYVVSLYNEMARFLRLIFIGCSRPRPSLSDSIC
jgi:hypothetical protein